MEIDYGHFVAAFARDINFHDPCPRNTFLDRKTGEVVWVYDKDEDASMDSGIPERDNRERSMQVASDPTRYLPVPGLSHGDHHGILKAFLASEWTQDADECERVRAAYFGSIGGWMDTVGSDAAIEAFQRFKEARIQQLAEAFLIKNGLVPKWK